jgi:hypothetical protein
MRDDRNDDGPLARYRKAKAARSAWEALWDECYEYALPTRGAARSAGGGDRRGDRLFDATAPDAVDQLAASLLAELTPPWSRWFGFRPGDDIAPEGRDEFARRLDDAAERIQSHFDRSNFAVEIHQCFLDLATAGTACLLFEEAEIGRPSAFRFAAVPLAEAVLEEGPTGQLDVTYRRVEMTRAEILARFPDARLPETTLGRSGEGAPAKFPILEAVWPEGPAYRYALLLEGEGEADGSATPLIDGRFQASPFINFRWLKAPGEFYGRSPVMKALPDIKTVNKVVELVLKNASIAVTGIWQADDDGVLNPANVRLVPGSIIPKAVGSAGLTPLEAPGRFDVSELVLTDMRARVRHALLVDRLAPLESPRMTATEVLERSAEATRVLGATFGRLQAELLSPLVARAVSILRRRGEIDDFALDGRHAVLQHRSPLARTQAASDVQGVLRWLETARGLGPEATATIDVAETARWLARSLGVPPTLVRSAPAPLPMPGGRHV